MDSLPTIAGALAAAAPLCLVLAALAPFSESTPRRTTAAAALAFALSLVASFTTALSPSGVTRLPLGSVTSLRLDGVGIVSLILVTGLGLVVARYAERYLHGDPQRHRHARWLLATLSAVTTIVLAGDLATMALAWTATSVALHQLLTLYRERQTALVAAHKKFLISRLADVFLGGALMVLGASAGTLDLEGVLAWAQRPDASRLSLELAATCLVIAVALRTAQLPFHGWLVQVMEAPTTVSALLHAGVVNIGGLVAIRLAPLVGASAIAQSALVGIGTTTLVIAALVMTTRNSAKVALAWSTCAQMGLMLVECGLGAWDLALLHLVAHSLYKAYAFLSAGSAVDAWRRESMWSPGLRAPTGSAGMVATALVAVFGAAAIAATSAGSLREPATLFLVLLLAPSIAPLAARAPGTGLRGWIALSARGGMIALFFLGAHWLFEGLTRTGALATTTPDLAWWAAVLGLSALFIVRAVLAAHPDGALAAALRPHLRAGLYLDELLTRWTFQLWPPRLPISTGPTRAMIPSAVDSMGVR